MDFYLLITLVQWNIEACWQAEEWTEIVNVKAQRWIILPAILGPGLNTMTSMWHSIVSLLAGLHETVIYLKAMCNLNKDKSEVTDEFSMHLRPPTYSLLYVKILDTLTLLKTENTFSVV